MNLKKIFSVKNKYDGLKKYKLVSVLGLEFIIRTSSYKDFKLKLLNDLENYDGINCEENQREKCTLSICAIYKNEPDIKEWIEYHRMPITKIRINHYHTKSLEDWQRKLNLGFADSKEKRKFINLLPSLSSHAASG